MPIDRESGMVEPDITINGLPLSFAECMAVRVAISSFRMQLSSVSVRAQLGQQLAHNYDVHLSSVEQVMRTRP